MTQKDGAAFRRECAWCSAPAPAGATQCPACGAALAQRTSIGGLTIPGVTNVDPALKAFDEQPLHIPKPSPSQGIASGAILAAAAGGPIGLAALGGLAAVAAAEYMGAGRGRVSRPEDLGPVGTPSAAALAALERLERDGGVGAPPSDSSAPQGGEEPPSGRTE